MRRERTVDVLVVGAGPAGLSAARALRRAGAGRVEVVDREHEAGGVPRHSDHPGYGLRDLRRVLSGPRYARELTGRAVAEGADVRTGVTVTGWSGPLALDLTSPAGLERVSASAVVLATGARERPRAARLIPGSRPAGVLTTGELQQSVHLHGQTIGTRAVVVGAEHVGYSAVLTLREAGVEVVAMVTEHPRPQSYPAFHLGAAVRFGVRPLLSTRVAAIRGRGRVEAVDLVRPDGGTRTVACDTVVLTGDWIPDHELARRGGIAVDAGTRGPVVDAAFRTDRPGVFAIGNLVHPVETADVCALDGVAVAGAVTGWLGSGEWPAAPVAVEAVAPLRWVAPQRLVPGRPARLTVWSAEVLDGARVTVTQGGRELGATRRGRPAPGRPVHVTAHDVADAASGPLSVQAHVPGRWPPTP